ncbi:YwqJ-related putative deaminase [Rickettsiella endosymbiont of Rhagonycha lignosa]|uniref:YwqJ-related putative deaminase n=1 Tax=Rickettsiella endosymbiont of Rhagonycha lignosa TaxID=3077937 RepID=UPI00313E59B5
MKSQKKRSLNALDLAGDKCDDLKIVQCLFKKFPIVRVAYKMLEDSTNQLLKKGKEEREAMGNQKLSDRTLQTALRTMKFSPAFYKAASAYSTSVNVMESNKINSLFNNIDGGEINSFPGVGNVSVRTYLIVNLDAFLNAVDEKYKKYGEAGLHPIIRSRITHHLKKNNYTIPRSAGIPGLHAEIVALNDQLWQHHDHFPSVAKKIKNTSLFFRTMNNTIIMTKRLYKTKGGREGDDFKACFNCSGILTFPVNILTGIAYVEETERAYRRKSI